MKNSHIYLASIASLLLAVGCETSEPDNGGNGGGGGTHKLYDSISSDAMPAPQEFGDIIPDFSRVGYHYGDKEIPYIAVVKTLTAPDYGADATAMIQNAINEVGLNGGGAILLKAGTYNIGNTINLNRSNVVLRGEGYEEGSKTLTKLVATAAKQYSLLNVTGSGSRVLGTAANVTDDYVPCGQFFVNVDNPTQFAVGDLVSVFRPSPQEWITAIKMDDIPPRTDGSPVYQWEDGSYNFYAERTITRIDGNTLHFENPLVMSLDKQYGGGKVYQTTISGRISECGVENIYFESKYAAGNNTDEKHGWRAVNVTLAENCWVRDVRSKYFGYSCVALEGYAKKVTVENCHCEQPISIITGGRRYSFYISSGTMNLFKNCTADEGRHDYVTGSRGSGPNVFYNCKATNVHADIGPHHRWNMGTLYDNIVTDGEINVQDRASFGSGHGWAGANQVFWNVTADKVCCQNPWATAYNYSIGSKAEKWDGSYNKPLKKPDGVWISKGKHVFPQSLYQSQLELRRKIQPGGVMDVD